MRFSIFVLVLFTLHTPAHGESVDRLSIPSEVESHASINQRYNEIRSLKWNDLSEVERNEFIELSGVMNRGALIVGNSPMTPEDALEYRKQQILGVIQNQVVAGAYRFARQFDRLKVPSEDETFSELHERYEAIKDLKWKDLTDLERQEFVELSQSLNKVVFVYGKSPISPEGALEWRKRQILGRIQTQVVAGVYNCARGLTEVKCGRLTGAGNT